ncbi:hypothetical protein F5884DRAFT_896163 [Xylogone sp. PMI_703]|nr:hypothetical protein F5884DRAFT_896163 [Xylogone sp. PMI_703]
MPSASLLKRRTQPDLYVCARCSFQASRIPNRSSRRWIGQKYLAKLADAEMAWQEKAYKIRAGQQKSMLTILEERGYVHSIAGTRVAVDKAMTDKRIGAYVGVDPTAASLHIGHLLPFMALFWMHIHGYHTVSLLGGATAKIGDPTDRLTTREKQVSSLRTENMVKMHYQLKKLWANVEVYAKKYGYIRDWSWKRGLVNNNVWMNKLNIMEILQVLGHGMRLGPMLARDTVKNKMEKGDGMSFAEFTYPLLQAWDWWHMYNTMGITMQIGGSDQFGNITAGIDAVKYICTHHPDPAIREASTATPFGFTVPLLTTSSGAKFGKSAGNAIWLNKEMTSTFDLYGFFLRTSDADVGKYLKLFTFMPIEEIDALVAEHMKDASQRKAQHRLASEFVELVHGPEEATSVAEQHRLLFRNHSAPLEISSLTSSTGEASGLDDKPVTLNNAPQISLRLPRSLIFTKSIGRIFYAAGLVSSASEGHRLASNQALYIGGPPGGKKESMMDGQLTFQRVKVWRPEETKNFLIQDKILILRRGKHNVRVVEVIDDEEYEASGETYPGMAPKEGAKDEANGIEER